MIDFLNIKEIPKNLDIKIDEQGNILIAIKLTLKDLFNDIDIEKEKGINLEEILNNLSEKFIHIFKDEKLVIMFPCNDEINLKKYPSLMFSFFPKMALDNTRDTTTFIAPYFTEDNYGEISFSSINRANNNNSQNELYTEKRDYTFSFDSNIASDINNYHIGITKELKYKALYEFILKKEVNIDILSYTLEVMAKSLLKEKGKFKLNKNNKSSLLLQGYFKNLESLYEMGIFKKEKHFKYFINGFIKKINLINSDLYNFVRISVLYTLIMVNAKKKFSRKIFKETYLFKRRESFIESLIKYNLPISKKMLKIFDLYIDDEKQKTIFKGKENPFNKLNSPLTKDRIINSAMDIMICCFLKLFIPKNLPPFLLTRDKGLYFLMKATMPDFIFYSKDIPTYSDEYLDKEFINNFKPFENTLIRPKPTNDLALKEIDNFINIELDKAIK